MSIVLEEFVNKIGWQIDTKQLSEGMQRVRSTMDKLKPVVQRLATAVSLPLTVFAGVSLKLASDAQEVNSKFDAVFRGMEERAGSLAQNFALNFGLAGSSAREMLGDTSDLLTGFGFTQESALGLSEQVNSLAIDLASFTNYSGGAKGASSAVTKALFGETEAMKSLGVAILQKDVQDRIAQARAEGRVFASDQEAKALITLQMIMEQSKNAIGDYSRTSQESANSSRRVKQRLKELSEQLGTILLPIVNKFQHAFENLLKLFIKAPQFVKVLAVLIGAVFAILPPLILAIWGVTSAVATLGTTTVVATGGIVLLIPLFIAWLAVLGKIYHSIYKFIKPLVTSSDEFIKLKENVKLFIAEMKLRLLPVFEVLKKAFFVWLSVVKKVFGFIGKYIATYIKIVIFYINALVSVIKVFYGAYKKVFDGIANLIRSAITVWKFFFETTLGIFGTSIDEIKEKFSQFGGGARQKMILFIAGLMVPIKLFSRFIEEKVKFILDKVDSVKDAYNKVNGFMQSGADKIVDTAFRLTGQGSYGVSDYDPNALREQLRADNGANSIQQVNTVTIEVPQGTPQAQQDALAGIVTTNLPNYLTGQMSSALAVTSGME